MTRKAVLKSGWLKGVHLHRTDAKKQSDGLRAATVTEAIDGGGESERINRLGCEGPAVLGCGISALYTKKDGLHKKL